MRYVALVIAGVFAAAYLLIIILLFLAHSIAVLFILPLRKIEENFSWDFSEEPPIKKPFWSWVYSVYAFEMRGDLIWEVIYDELIPLKWKRKN